MKQFIIFAAAFIIGSIIGYGIGYVRGFRSCLDKIEKDEGRAKK